MAGGQREREREMETEKLFPPLLRGERSEGPWKTGLNQAN